MVRAGAPRTQGCRRSIKGHAAAKGRCSRQNSADRALPRGKIPSIAEIERLQQLEESQPRTIQGNFESRPPDGARPTLVLILMQAIWRLNNRQPAR